jgi:DNA-binding response OmpR family regulator
MPQTQGSQRVTPARVFVVEDEAMIALALEVFLRGWGMQCCGRAARAADALLEIRAAQPDLVLMDVDLGPGMSGIELARELQLVVATRFLFMSGGDLQELEESARDVASFAFLGKPYTASELRVAVERALQPVASEALFA